MLKNIKLLKKGLIALDLVLVIVAMVFLFNYLLFPKNIDYLSDLPEEPPLPPIKKAPTIDRIFYQVISQLPSPIIVTKPVEQVTTIEPPNPDPVSKYVRVDGTMPESDPKIGSALLFLLTKNQAVVTFAGDEVVDITGEPVRELRGAKLYEVYLDRVVFDKNGKKETLKAPEMAGAGAIGEGVVVTAIPTNFDIKTSKSKKMSSTADKEVWQIDPNEAAMMQDANKVNDIINNDLALSIYPSGGVKLDSVKADSLPAMRGIKAGDVIKSINGKEIKTPDDAKNILNDPAARIGKSVNMILDRAGRKMTIEYKLGK